MNFQIGSIFFLSMTVLCCGWPMVSVGTFEPGRLCPSMLLLSKIHLLWPAALYQIKQFMRPHHQTTLLLLRHFLCTRTCLILFPDFQVLHFVTNMNFLVLIPNTFPPKLPPLLTTDANVGISMLTQQKIQDHLWYFLLSWVRHPSALFQFLSSNLRSLNLSLSALS